MQSRPILCVAFLWLCTCYPVSSAYLNKFLGKSHEESCAADTDPCNSVKFLSCMDGKCECAAPTEMIYDNDRDSCTALASFSCLRSIPDSLPDTSNSVQSPKLYYTPCVTNAKCIYPGDTCQCDFRFYEAANHTCVQQHNYGAECSLDEHCDEFRFFSCINGKCSCDSSKNHTYDQKNDKCMVPVGNSCKVIEFQSISEDFFRTDECPEHAACDQGTCRCKDGYRITNDKTCGKELGDSCDAMDNKCSDIQFTCRNQKCSCKYPSHQVSISGTECVSLVSGPCTTDKDAKTVDDPNFIQNCTENAFCQESTAFNYCKCKEGYVETNEGTCVKAYGMACQVDEECDNLAPLACIENKCDCADRLSVFDDKLRRCVGLAGSRCWKDGNSTSAVCTSNAYCVKANSQLNWGKCICARGFVTTPQKTCAKAN